jgi:serine/threonine protein phosphatase 1
VTDTYLPELLADDKLLAPLFRVRERRVEAPVAATANKKNAGKVWTPRAPAGAAVYAIGDIHGRADLLDDLLRQISDDARLAPGAVRPSLVMLGDYIDRGAASREVIDHLLSIPKYQFDLYFLRGNHESALIDFINRPETGPTWMTLGGAATLMSYGLRVPAPGANALAWRNAAEGLRTAMPPTHMRFLSQLRYYVRLGDYLFVHAGLRPGKSLARQRPEDLTEIREPFLNSKNRWPFMIVHGHSPTDKAARMGNRISLDTGAFATGKLSAVKLYGDQVDFFST